ncbi:MAG TPA: endonuclease/exonuclease/phosphatase family protein [Polyangiales bacterium]|nr:endonuclease/exonuclease/phosphatase family protein [Polyangiales bacterium]
MASWNLEWLNRANGSGPVKRSDADYARLRAYAERLAADVIAFQEVDGVEAARRVFDPARYQLHVATRGDTQRTGFAVRKGITLQIHPDYDELDRGGLRAGADVTVVKGELTLRILSVHLKSGCFDAPLNGAQRECQKLAEQLPILETWIDQRGREHVPAVVLGDFNRRLFARKADAFWAQLDDADPPDSDLWSPTDGQPSTCWSGEHPDFIDHIVLNVPAKRASISDSFEMFQYDASDNGKRRVLSDHCPIALTFEALAHGVVVAKPKALPAPLPVPPLAIERTKTPIKGNINGKGKKLYHAPGCPDYPRVLVDESKGERWFANPGDAESAGFSRASNCP